VPEPVTTAAALSPVIKSAMDRLGDFVNKNAGAFTKPIKDRAVVELGLGMKAYLEASYNRCRYFKTILNQSQPLEVTKYYVHNTLFCGQKRVTDDELIEEVGSLLHVVVTGLAGSGKSMFMKYFTVSKFENPAGSIPIFIELRSLNNISKRDLVEFVRASCIAKGYEVTSDQFKIALSSGLFTLILDGFDELKHEFRDDISAQLLEVGRLYPKTPIIVSSRPDSRFGAWTDFYVYSVDALNKKQSLELIESLEYDAGVKKRFHKEVKDRLYDSHTSFLSSPLLTTIMLLTFEEFAEIPVRMHAFYSQAFDTLFQKHDASKEQFQRDTHTGLTKEDFRTIFSAFCAMSYLNQRFSFEDEKLLETADSAFSYAKQTKMIIPSGVGPQELIADLKESVCLLQQDGLETAFVHRSFQEFFAAVFATSLSDEKMKRIIDKYSVRFTDSVVSMTMDMARESVEQCWVLPKLSEMYDAFELGNNNKSITEQFRLLFAGIMYHCRDNGDCGPSIPNLNDENLGPFETLCRLYPKNLGVVHFAKYLDFNIEKCRGNLLAEENRGKYGYDIFEEIYENFRNKNNRIVEFNFANDCDWWLNIIGAEKTFADVAKAIPVIRRDISTRAKKRDIILDEFL